MTGVQAQLDKIRSDAAECRMLANLAPDGKRQMFTSMAEHLNALALEIQKTIAATGTTQAIATKEPEAAAVNASEGATAQRRHIVPWLLVVLLVTLAGGLIWANKLPGKDWLLTTWRQMHELPGGAEHASISSGEDDASLREQVVALTTRLDHIERELDSLKSAHAEPTEPSKGEVVPVQSDDPVTIGGIKTTGPEQRPAKQMDNAPIVGPPGCMRLRSFDPASGTYINASGRRRPCR